MAPSSPTPGSTTGGPGTPLVIGITAAPAGAVDCPATRQVVELIQVIARRSMSGTERGVPGIPLVIGTTLDPPEPLEGPTATQSADV